MGMNEAVPSWGSNCKRWAQPGQMEIGAGRGGPVLLALLEEHSAGNNHPSQPEGGGAKGT